MSTCSRPSRNFFGQGQIERRTNHHLLVTTFSNCYSTKMNYESYFFLASKGRAENYTVVTL